MRQGPSDGFASLLTASFPMSLRQHSTSRMIRVTDCLECAHFESARIPNRSLESLLCKSLESLICEHQESRDFLLCLEMFLRGNRGIRIPC
jgi:hypothetical protein